MSVLLNGQNKNFMLYVWSWWWSMSWYECGARGAILNVHFKLMKQIRINHLNRSMTVENVSADGHRKYLITKNTYRCSGRNSNVYIFMQSSNHFLLMDKYSSVDLKWKVTSMGNKLFWLTWPKASLNTLFRFVFSIVGICKAFGGNK